MPEPANAAIEKALLDKAIAFAAAQDPVLLISVENGLGADGRRFTKPAPSKTAMYLRAAVLPAPALSTGIASMRTFNTTDPANRCSRSIQLI
jgi:hypothetical protein